MAEFNDAGNNTGMAILRGYQELYEYLDNLSGIQRIVIEDFRLRSDKAIEQSGSTMPAVLAIGAIQYAAHRLNTPTELVPAANHARAKNIGGLKVPPNHNFSHHIVAHNHGIWWLTKHGIRQPTQIPKELRF